MNLSITRRLAHSFQEQRATLQSTTNPREIGKQVELGIRTAFGGFNPELAFYGDHFQSPKPGAPELIVKVEPGNHAVMGRIVSATGHSGVLYLAKRGLLVVAQDDSVRINDEPFELRMPRVGDVGGFPNLRTADPTLNRRLAHAVVQNGTTAESAASDACAKLLLGELAGAILIASYANPAVPLILQKAGFTVTDQDGRPFAEEGSTVLVAAHRVAHGRIIDSLRPEAAF